MENENNKNRLFIAIEFSDEVIKEAARVEKLIQNWPFNGKTTELENLHLTLKFLGELDEEKIEKIKKALRRVDFPNFNVSLGQLGVFYYRKNPKIIWVKIIGKELYELQKKIDEELFKDNLFKKEERFTSHMTLARINYVKDKKGFIERVRNIKVMKISCPISKFTLKSSELRITGRVYTDLESFNLK